MVKVYICSEVKKWRDKLVHSESFEYEQDCNL
jgi:hypothetical protein